MMDPSEMSQANDPSVRGANVSPVAKRDTGLDLFGPTDARGLGEVSSGVSVVPTKPPFSMWSLLRYKWSVLLITVLGSGIALPCIWFLTTPMFHARGVIRVAPIVSRMVYKTENNVLVPLYQSYLNTQVSVIRSPKVLQRVLDRADVRQTAWYNQEAGWSIHDPQSRLERLGVGLSVRPRRGTELIDVGFDARHRGDTKLLVDAVLDEYTKYTDEAAAQSDTLRYRTLQERKKTLHDDVESLTALKNSLAKRLGTSAPEQLWSERGTQLNALDAERAALIRLRELAAWDFKLLGPVGEEPAEGAMAAAVADSSAEPRYADDSEWRARSREVEGALHELELARQQYGGLHPRIARLETTIEQHRAMLQQREQQLDERPAAVAIPSVVVANAGVDLVDRRTLSHRIRRLGRSIEILDEAIGSQRAKVNTAADFTVDITSWDEEIRFKRLEYEAVRIRLQQLESESKAPARISIAAYGVQPSRPSKDRRIVLSAFAVCAFLGFGLSLAYLRVTLDSRIRVVDDVRGAVHGPFLGQLPPLPPIEDLMADRDGLVMERVRIVRTAMLERLRDSRNSVILITSSSARAGKTSVAVLLARSLAQLGKRTLLVEADLRRPALSQNLGLDSRAGLSALLAGSLDDTDALVPTDLENLDIVPAGRRPDDFNPELLANGVFTACLDRWRKTYDIVLLDSPPVPAVADARILAAHADGTILVLRSAHCRRAEVMRAYLDLQAAGTTLLGTVLVGGPASNQYGYYGYSGYPEAGASRKAISAP